MKLQFDAARCWIEWDGTWNNLIIYSCWRWLESMRVGNFEFDWIPCMRLPYTFEDIEQCENSENFHWENAWRVCCRWESSKLRCCVKMCRHVRHSGEVCKVQSSPFDRSKSHDNDALNCIKIAANIDIVDGEVCRLGKGEKFSIILPLSKSIFSLFRVIWLGVS